MSNSANATFLAVLAITIVLAAAWRYPEQVKALYDTYTSVMTAFYALFGALVAIVFLSTGHALLVILGVFILAALVLRVWFDYGGKTRVRDLT